MVLERGLAKETFETLDGRCCAVGAIRIVEFGCSHCDEVSDVERLLGWEFGNDIGRWNDDSDTTARDVASLLYSESEVVDE